MSQSRADREGWLKGWKQRVRQLKSETYPRLSFSGSRGALLVHTVEGQERYGEERGLLHQREIYHLCALLYTEEVVDVHHGHRAVPLSWMMKEQHGGAVPPSCDRRAWRTHLPGLRRGSRPTLDDGPFVPPR